MSVVPTVTAAIANRPSGVRRSENRLARPSTRSRTWSAPSSGSFFSIPISATPRKALNSTTAGTMLLARDWNGFAGM